jgi:hypothetical protein
MFAQNVLSSDLYGYTVVKVFDLTAYPPDYVRFRANIDTPPAVAADRLQHGYAWRVLPAIVLVVEVSLARVGGG